MATDLERRKTTPQPRISRLVRRAFRSWRDAGVSFLVLRNYQGLPESTTNDIDILVHPGQLGLAEELLRGAALATGFRLHNRAEFVPIALYFSSSDCEQAHFDLFSAVRWHSFDFVDWKRMLESAHEFRPRPDDDFSFPVPHPAHEASSNLLSGLVYGGKVKPKYKPEIAAAFRQHSGEALAFLELVLSARVSRQLVEAAAQQRWEEIETLHGRLRRMLITRQAARRPLRAIRAVLKDAKRLGNRFCKPPGLRVALCGSDGSGKSTVAPLAIEILEPSFSLEKGAHYHWKPAIFSKARRKARGPETDPHGKQARGRLASLFYFAVHWLEFFIGFCFHVHPMKFRGGLALVDRSYFDFFIDQKRYRLQVPVGLVKLGYALLPKPDLVVLLDAPPELLRNRKQELPLPELQRQRLAFQQLVQALPHAAVIDASRPPEEVARNIARAVLERSAQRYSEFSEPKNRSGYLSRGLSALCWGEFLFLP